MEKIPWVWWERNEPETGLLGFDTEKDRDRFSNNEPGPYRRRISKDGRTISQLATYRQIVGLEPMPED